MVSLGYASPAPGFIEAAKSFFLVGNHGFMAHRHGGAKSRFRFGDPFGPELETRARRGSGNCVGWPIAKAAQLCRRGRSGAMANAGGELEGASIGAGRRSPSCRRAPTITENR